MMSLDGCRLYQGFSVRKVKIKAGFWCGLRNAVLNKEGFLCL